MDTRFDENQAEFRVFIFSVTFEVLSNSNSLTDGDSLAIAKITSLVNINANYLLDQHVQVLRDVGCEACEGKITPSVNDQSEAQKQQAL